MRQTSDEAAGDKTGIVRGDVARAADREASGGKRVTRPTEGLYDSIDPKKAPPTVQIEHQDLAAVEADVRAGRRARLKTIVKTADGKSQGEMIRAYDPQTKTLEMISAFFPDELPTRVPHRTSLDPQNPQDGVPLSAYVQMQQLKIFDVATGEVRHVKLKNVVNVVTAVQLEIAARAAGVSADQLPPDTVARHALQYVDTPLVQSGHRLIAARLHGGSTDAIGQWIDMARSDGYGHKADRAEALMREHGIRREDQVLLGFDIEADVVPFEGAP
jgi:hypothetical protein